MSGSAMPPRLTHFRSWPLSGPSTTSSPLSRSQCGGEPPTPRIPSTLSVSPTVPPSGPVSPTSRSSTVGCSHHRHRRHVLHGCRNRLDVEHPRPSDRRATGRHRTGVGGPPELVLVRLVVVQPGRPRIRRVARGSEPEAGSLETCDLALPTWSSTTILRVAATSETARHSPLTRSETSWDGKMAPGRHLYVHTVNRLSQMLLRL